MSVLPPVYTIGHSTRTIGEFVDLLRVGGVTLVADVRSVPRSRTNPQYNLDVLSGELAPYQIGYVHIAELGGLRGRSRDVSAGANSFWQNASFRNYADYAQGPEFRRGLDRLLSLSSKQTCAIMCAEAVWWRCHRRIIADYLMLKRRAVIHLMGNGRVEPARMTTAARAVGDTLFYDQLPVAAGAVDGA